MGICWSSSLTPEERAAIAYSSQIERELNGDFETDRRVIKLLLLGTGESGKSTIFKQMQILYQQGFSEFEKSTFRHVVRRNVVESMQTLIHAVAHRFHFEWENPESVDAANFMSKLDALTADFWQDEVVGCVKKLWSSEPAIQKAYLQKSQLQLLDSTEYLYENIDRIGNADYIPTQEDILRARLRTSGIVERLFHIKHVDFKFLDVGGQRNERRKWIHCFEGVTAIIFVAAISEYDQVLYEDEKINRMHETLRVWENICNHRYFTNTSMILFLNKIDLFEDKISRIPLTTCFTEYEQEDDTDDPFNSAAEYIKAKFLELNAGDKMIFPFFTCATDTDNIEKVFEACRLIILKNNLSTLGIE